MLGAPSCRAAPPMLPIMLGSHPGPPLVSTWWSWWSLPDSTQSTVLCCRTGIWSNSTLLSCQQTLLVSSTVDSGIDIVLLTQLTMTFYWMSLMRASSTKKNSCVCGKSTWRMHVCGDPSGTAWNGHFLQMKHTHCGYAGLNNLPALLTAHPHQCTQKYTDPIDQIQWRLVHHRGMQHSPYMTPMVRL